MSNSGFLIYCLVAVFVLIAAVGAILTATMVHRTTKKAWASKAALAKATGAAVPAEPKPVVLIVVWLVCIAALAALVLPPVLTVSIRIDMPPRAAKSTTAPASSAPAAAPVAPPTSPVAPTTPAPPPSPAK